MTSKRSTLPRNAGSLQRMLAEKEALLSERERIIAEKETQLAERDRLIAVRDAELYAKTLQIEHLKAQLAVLRRTRFGRSSEKLDREIEQLEMLLGELEEGVAESNARAEQIEKEPASPRRATPRNHKPTGRKPLLCAAAADLGLDGVDRLKALFTFGDGRWIGCVFLCGSQRLRATWQELPATGTSR